MSDRPPLSDASLRALGAVARRAIDGELPASDHDAGRERALAAFARRGRRAPRRALWIVAAALAAAIVTAVLVWSPPAPLSFTVDGRAVSAGAYVHAPPGGASVRFSDGSEIAFTAGSSGRITEAGPRGARVLLESGTAAVHVRHLPAARWSVEAGPFVITVVGTAFDVTWSADTQTLEIDLREGAVRVRGPLAPNGVDLRAGQHLVARTSDGDIHIGASRPTATSTPPAPPPQLDPPAPVPPPTASARVAPAITAAPLRPSRWPERVAAGDFRGVLGDADARGLDAVMRHAPLADLVALADAARYAGRADVARRALLTQRERFASTAEARAAAFLLGRLADDGGGTREDALRWYDRYLAEAPQGAFAAEALGRKMTALRRAGDPAAGAVAAEYLRLYPSGPHAPAAREIAPSR